MLRRTPLAWKNLTYDPRRLLIAVGGVGFAVLLMFIEVGFLNALLDSTVQVLQLLRGDLVIVSQTKFAMAARERFDIRRVYQARSTPGVAAVHPIYMETMGAIVRQRGPDPPRGYPIRVFGTAEAQEVWQLPAVQTLAERLREPDVAMLDAASRAQYGLPTRADALREAEVELAGRRLRFVGTFYLGVDFTNDGNLIMDAENFARFFPERGEGKETLSVVDLAMVQVSPDSKVEVVQERLQQRLPDDVRVETKAQFIAREKLFWRKNTPVGYIFFIGALVGFLVGVIICYQIIYADIADHIPEFATLKAMGYRHPYFFGLVLAQALYLSLLGFIPGWLASLGIYQLLAHITGLTMQMKLSTAAGIFAATVAMCVLSGLLAVRKLLAADPADLF